MHVFEVCLIFIWIYPQKIKKCKVKTEIEETKGKKQTMKEQNDRKNYGYEPFFETLKKKGISQSQLIKKYDVSAGTINRMKHNKNMTLAALGHIMNVIGVSKLSDVLRIDLPDNSEKIKQYPACVFLTEDEMDPEDLMEDETREDVLEQK